MYKEMSEMMYYYILKAEMVFLRQYKINPFDVIKGMSLLDLNTYLKTLQTEEEKEQWQKAYKFLLKDISWRMTNEALKYIKDHPEDFDILTEAEQQIINLYDALRLVEYYVTELEAGRGDDFSIGKIVEAMNATGLTSLQESAMKISLDVFTEHLHEKNANHAAILDLMREYPEDNNKVMECLNMDEATYKTALNSIREDFKAFLN